eukprot:CAMPEP_0114577178 /NCGR_PEP_ID=MMETSP0125-20121206/1866_1 /TAXON_ID=485358 ORGANISM="Aristerostoma sp., Strain ATCC 50986" /NCGR_SAMPLE_ID=MMETSP0125 /ASSEMBLY_ACC=CAM_ASM_000245 /LENGTH=30 /DNA_ID= /DNA_START= /DNA_END= /DNA_ORIENTATION=
MGTENSRSKFIEEIEEPEEEEKNGNLTKQL